MSLTTTVRLAVSARQDNAIDLGASRASRTLDLALTLADGLDAGEADRAFVDTRTIAASGTDDLDLAGALTDAFGATAAFARVKALVVRASADNTNNVLVGGDAANAFASWAASATDIVVLRPGATLALVAGAADAVGYTVTAGTGDLLQIANSAAGTAVTYDVVVIGCSA